MNINSESEYVTNSNKIKEIESKFFSVLDDYKKYYVFYNMHPEINENENAFSNADGQLKSLSENLFMITNSINNSINTLNEEMEIVEQDISKEKARYSKLVEKIKYIDNTYEGSEQLISDTKQEYNMQYYNNLEILLGVGIISVAMYNIFKVNQNAV